MSSPLENGFRNRLIGELPKIGIRPVIDGRRNGVREALEDKTQRMAAAVCTCFQARQRVVLLVVTGSDPRVQMRATGRSGN